MASRTDGFAELRRQLDIADADISLVNKRLDESQGTWLLRGRLVRRLTPFLTICMLDADGAATMEGLRAELARAKEQARKSEAAALKAAEELEAEKAAHCRSREEMAGMATKLKVATDCLEVLEGERRAEQEDLKKADAEAKDARSAMRAMKEELRQIRDIAAGKPFMLRRKFTDPKYAQLGRLYGAEDPYLDLAASGGHSRALSKPGGS